ncbi:transketolase family protein [Bifidobacterium tsurumiense]|uniref:Transketolase n=1 Tax=Bifidobacterium tsurumiense TaxID=356829 RepID=A0A087ECL0_9BIFI|nr:transketolase C-terminal domain-containing protein [Bifidobacterium tsurumiense]KFJ05511.1 transketolase [Bifidobacterium tsurumiense]MDY4677788.1 transketolase C-terminal domain-containing protein [Bifidobacterium tsurumiense]
MKKVSTREIYGRTLCELGDRDDSVVVVDADLSLCTMTCYFAGKHPERFFNVGISEANMVGVGAGLAATGKTVFVNSFAMFTAGRAYDQIRNSVCYPHLNVKVVGTHAGLTVGEDGATHQCVEDMSLMRTVPGMTVIVPCDAEETRQAVYAMADYNGPCYFRLGRAPVSNVVDSLPGYKFEIGKAVTVKEGTDVTVIAAGTMVEVALEASSALKVKGINARVINMHTIKPIDRNAILSAARETGAIVTAEEHNVIGGLGSAVSEVIVESDTRVPVVRVGVQDVFGHSAPAEVCMAAYGLTSDRVAQAVQQAIAMR